MRVQLDKLKTGAGDIAKTAVDGKSAFPEK